MKDIIANYNFLKVNLAELIKKSGYRNDFIAEKIGMAPAYFSVKKQRANWTEEEAKKILDVIESEEVEDYFLGLFMQCLESDETLSLSEFKAEVKWK